MEKIAKTNTDQGLASWIQYLNYLRFCELTERLSLQSKNFEDAMEQIQLLKEFVSDPTHILGSMLTKHGEIAEQAEVRVNNAINAVKGLPLEYQIDNVGRLDKADYLHNGKMVQSKFCKGLAGTDFAINHHLLTYPDFLTEDGTYRIAKDNYDAFIDIYNRGLNGELSSNSEIRLFQAIQEWENETGYIFKDVVKPSRFTYDDVQLDRIDDTIAREEKNINEINQDEIKTIRSETRPSVNERIKIAKTSAAIEGSAAFAVKVYKKRKEGIKIRDYSSDDWKDVGFETAIGATKGAVRGSSIYYLTNFKNISAPASSAMVTATFGVVSQALKLRANQISASEFIESSEAICLDASISAISAACGQTIIPIPVLGAVIGNTIGMTLFSISTTYLNNEEQGLINEYVEEYRSYIDSLNEEYKNTIAEANSNLIIYGNMVDLAFSNDVNIRLESSIARAKFLGVDHKEIIKSKNEGDRIFLSSEPIEL